MRLLTLTLIFVVWSGSAAYAGDLTCALPFSFVDRWADTDGSATYDAEELYDPLLTGFVAPADVGFPLTLTAANPMSPAAENSYVLIALPPMGSGAPPQTGESWLRKWVSQCAPYGVSSGDSLSLEPGTLFSALLEELNGLVAADPDAYWDDATMTVKGSAFGVTPRLLAVSCFDPRYPPTSSDNYVVVTKIAVVFLESTTGPTTIQVRFIDNATETVAVKAATWGRVKNDFGTQD